MVPLNYFITGNPGNGSLARSRVAIVGRKLRRLFQRRSMTFRNLDSVSRYDVLLVCYYPYYAHEFSEFVTQVKQHAPETIIIGTIDVQLTYIQESLKNPEKFLCFKAFLDACDVFASWFRGSESYFRFMTDTPVVYLPMPYPVEYVKQFYQQAKEKDRVILCSGETSRSDILTGQFIARRLHDRYPEFHIQLGPVNHRGMVGPFWSENRHPHIHAAPLQEGTYEVLWHQPSWEGFLQTLARTFLGINTDLTWTMGRFPNDAAGVGTPCIGMTANSQRDLFPDTTCFEPFDVDRVFKLACRLIEEPSFYEAVQRKALSRLEERSYHQSVKRFQQLLHCVATGDFTDWNPVSWPPI